MLRAGSPLCTRILVPHARPRAKPDQANARAGSCNGRLLARSADRKHTRLAHSTPRSIAQIAKQPLAGWRENQRHQHGVCLFKGIGDGDLLGSDSRQRIQEVRICSVCAFFTNCSRKIRCPKAGFCHHKNKTRSDSTHPCKLVAIEILLSTPCPFQQRKPTEDKIKAHTDVSDSLPSKIFRATRYGCHQSIRSLIFYENLWDGLFFILNLHAFRLQVTACSRILSSLLLSATLCPVLRALLFSIIV